MRRTYEIHVLDERDPVVVNKAGEDAIGIWFLDLDGRQVRLPWARVSRVVSYLTLDEPPADVEDEPAAVAEAEPSTAEPEPVPPDADPAAGKASEWAETDPAAVREWAKDQGLTVSDSGPISKAVLSKYAAAHSD